MYLSPKAELRFIREHLEGGGGAGELAVKLGGQQQPQQQQVG
jgi:hypothetical protein